jgi:hypothetical protein
VYCNGHEKYLCNVDLYILLDVVVCLDDVWGFWVCFCFKVGHVDENM